MDLSHLAALFKLKPTLWDCEKVPVASPYFGQSRCYRAWISIGMNFKAHEQTVCEFAIDFL